jgi:hypothetical protein
MTHFKGLLLGSAAAILGASAAQAADLPVVEALPAVEYVRVCDAIGSGFFFIPGTETCLRLSGYMQWAAFYRSNNSDGFDGEPEDLAFDETQNDQFDMRGRFRGRFDARTETDLGTLRGFAEFEWSGDGVRRGGEDLIRHAYVQLGGLTAGITSSQFNFGVVGPTFGTAVGDRTRRLPQIAYTQTFGAGFSITVSAEESDEANAAPNARLDGDPLSDDDLFERRVFDDRARQEVPDVVAALRYSGDFGSAQLAGVVRQVESFTEFLRDNDRFPCASPSVAADGPDPRQFACNSSDQEIGYAIMAGVSVNADLLGNGGEFSVKATYGEGAGNYVTSGRDGFLEFRDRDRSGTVTARDSFELELVEAFSVNAGVEVGLTPTITLAVYGGYAENMDEENDFGAVGTTESKYNVGATVTWSPVKNLNIAVEAIYGEREAFDLADVVDRDDAAVRAFDRDRDEDTDGAILWTGITRSF